MSNSAWGLCVQQKSVELYREPSEGAQKSWQVFRYMPFKKVSKKDGWYEVQDVDQQKHWIKETAVTTAFRCVVIENEFANLRTGPGTEFPKARAEKGTKYLAFRLLEEQADWVRVEDEQGDEAWIHRPLVWAP